MKKNILEDGLQMDKWQVIKEYQESWVLNQQVEKPISHLIFTWRSQEGSEICGIRLLS